MHPLHGLFFSAFCHEFHAPHVVSVIRCVPFTFKSKRIDQIHQGLFRDSVQNPFNHAIGVLFHKAIDFLQRAIIKIRHTKSGPIVIRVILQEFFIRNELPIFPDPYAIGQMRTESISLGQGRSISCKKPVQFLYRQAKHLLHARQCTFPSSVSRHAKSHGNG